MKTLLIAAALAVALTPLAGCTPPAAVSDHVAGAGKTIDAVQARYDAAKPFAEMLLPYLTPERAAQVRLAGAVIERALAVARGAATIAEQRAALVQAEAALPAVEQPTG